MIGSTLATRFRISEHEAEIRNLFRSRKKGGEAWIPRSEGMLNEHIARDYWLLAQEETSKIKGWRN